MKLFRVLPPLFFMCLLTSCSSLTKPIGVGDQANAYQTAQSTPLLKTPESMEHSGIGSETQTLPDNVTSKSLETLPLPSGSLAEQIKTGQVSKKVLDQKLPEPK